MTGLHQGGWWGAGWTTYASGKDVTTMAGHRLTQVLQPHLDLEFHLLLNANHLFRAAHLPDALIACLHHLRQGGRVRSSFQVSPDTTVTTVSRS